MRRKPTHFMTRQMNGRGTMRVYFMNRILLIAALMLIPLMPADTAAVVAGEEGLFSPVAPDTVIVLDISASMVLNPLDQMGTVNGVPDQPINLYGNAECSGTTFKPAPQTGYTTNCARYLIAQRAIFNILDDNKDGVINSQDDASLNIRMGFYTFNSDVQKRKEIGTSYAKIFCGKSSCSLSTPYDYSGTDNILALTDDRYWKSTFASNTAIALALEQVKTYLNDNKAADTYRNCRQKFVILVTDGGDTKYCDGNGDGNQKDQYKRRRASVLRAKELADAGYKVFVIGVSASLEPLLKRTLNWMAYHGGTDNPLVANSGNAASLVTSYFAADPCMTEPDTRLLAIPSSYGWPSGCNDDGLCGATLNDPGYTNQPLEGYAFFSASSTELEEALRQAINTIQNQSYAFSQSSVASSRVADENFVYEASFQPNFISNKCPFWAGHLEKFSLDANGNISATASADAYAKLRDKDPALRTMWTYKSGALTPFTTGNITSSDLGVENDTRRNEIVGYIRGEPAYNPYNTTKTTTGKVYKLGDIFRSSPVTVGTPSSDFQDPRDINHAFAAFRTANPRSSTNEKRIVVAGTNMGQLHAFRTSDLEEVWSFIPPNGLLKLRQIAHKTEPANQQHVYFVDGPISVADVWLGTGDGTAKSSTDWKTLLVFGEGRGASKVLWSNSSNCETSFNNMYNTATGHVHFCGYYALDITNTLAPAFKWRITPLEASAPYLGDPWSKIMIYRVKINGNEKWVGFLGGGHQLSVCSGSDCDKRGKGFFVIDLSNGNVLWSYTRSDNSAMDYAMPAPPTMLDTDLDGFIDTAYIGDLGGNIWRFKFCSAADGSSCNTGNWTGSRFFQRVGGTGPVYGAPAASKDTKGNLWLYWGTGDRLEPISTGGGTNSIYAVMDTGGTVTRDQLSNVTGSTYTDTGEKKGWYIILAGSGEKVLAEPAVFGGVAYFTSYIPSTGGDVCQQGQGTANLYALGYLTAASATGTGSNSIRIGYGIPTAPIISLKPGGTGSPDIYVTVSSGDYTTTRTVKAGLSPPTPSNRANMLYWRDRRIQPSALPSVPTPSM
jgi:hypothetical protein